MARGERAFEHESAHLIRQEGKLTKQCLRKRVQGLEKQIALISKNLGQRKGNSDPRIVDATRDTFTWVTKYAKTYNEHWKEEGRPEPYEHFPPYAYLQDLFDLLDLQRVNWIEKSRDMMISWACVAYLTLAAMKTPFRGVLLQTQKEDKVIQLVDYVKCLYKKQPEWLQEAFPLKKPIDKQPELELQFANGSYVAGIPGGADQIRSFHP